MFKQKCNLISKENKKKYKIHYVNLNMAPLVALAQLIGCRSGAKDDSQRSYGLGKNPVVWQCCGVRLPFLLSLWDIASAG